MSEPVTLQQIHDLLRTAFHEIHSSTDLLSITEWYWVKLNSQQAMVSDMYLKFTRTDVDPTDETGFTGTFELCVVDMRDHGVTEQEFTVRVTTRNHCKKYLKTAYNAMWRRAVGI
jgi:hypothetical protein